MLTDQFYEKQLIYKKFKIIEYVHQINLEKKTEFVYLLFEKMILKNDMLLVHIIEVQTNQKINCFVGINCC